MKNFFKDFAEIIGGIVAVAVMFGGGYAAGQNKKTAEDLLQAGERVEQKLERLSAQIDKLQRTVSLPPAGGMQ
jgi:hypothetical protein